MDQENTMAARYEREIPEGYEARIEGNKVIFELKESEDERIRKILIHIVKGACDKYGIKYIGDEIGQEKLLAYLEKQKEQQSADVSEKIKELCSKYPLNKNVASKQELSAYHQGLAFGATKIAEYLGAHQPTEWSEEDERTLESFLGWLQGSMGEKTYSSWLKSLPERFSLKPKQEWSEEDENIYNKALDAIYYKDCNEKDDVISALNDLCDLISRKRKVIPPYAHWKPSKEQMEALNAVANEGVLLDLFNDLLKLL